MMKSLFDFVKMILRLLFPIAVSVSMGCEATVDYFTAPPGDEPPSLMDLESGFREQVSNNLVAAAKQASVSVKTELMLIASRDDFFVALVPVATDRCDMFGFLALPKQDNGSSKVPPGYYLFDITLDVENPRVGTAALKDISGNVVLGDLSVTVEEAPSGAPPRDGLSLTLDAMEFGAKRWKPEPTPGLHFVDVIVIRF